MNIKYRGLFNEGIKLLLGVFLVSIVILFSWNSFAPDIFGLAVIKFKQALGIVLFLLTSGYLLRFGSRQTKYSSENHHCMNPE